MWLREVVFQGVFGVTKAAKIRMDTGFCRLALPPGIDPRAFQTLILSLLFPATLPTDDLRPLLDGDDLRIGLVIEVKARRQNTYKIFRRLDPSTIIVKDVTDPDAETVLAQGELEAEELLAQRLFLPPLPDFALLHAWELRPEALQVASLASAPTQDAEIARLLKLHQASVELEDIQQRSDELRADVRDLERELGRYGSPVADQQALKAREADLSKADLTEDERAFLQKSDTLRAELAEKLTTLTLELDEGRGAAPPLAPLWREALLWAPLLIALLLYVVSAVTGLRALALINILLLGVSASTLLRRFNRIEGAGQGDLRTGQIKRRCASIEEELATLDKRINALLLKSGARDLLQLRERLGDLERVRAEIAQVQADEPDPELKKHLDTLRAKLAKHQAELERLKNRQSAIDDPGMPSYELEQELLDRGFDRRSLKPNAPSNARPAEDPLAPFRAAAPMATTRGLFVMGRMIEKAAATFNKLATHLAGPTWEGVSLRPDGELVSPPTLEENLEERLRERPAEARLLLLALLSAIYASTAENHPLAQCRLLLLASPTRELPEKSAGHLNKMLQSLAARANVVVLQADGDPSL
jgi:hypothetical protein